MSTFYDAKYWLEGQTHRQQFYLPDRKSVRDEIASYGGYVLEIEERKTSELLSLLPFRGLQMRILRGLRFHMSANSSPGQALSKVYGQETGLARQVLEPGLEVLKRGGDFSTALDRPGIFDHVVRSLLIAGEKTGRIQESIEPALEHLQEKGKTKRMLATALGWLGTEFFFAISMIFGNQFVYLPYIENNMMDSVEGAKKAQLEKLIELAYMTNASLMAFTALIAVGAAAAFTSYAATRRDPQSRAAVLVQGVPIIRQYLINMQVYETFSVASRLIQGGVQISEAVRTVRRMAWVVPIRRYWDDALEIMERGKPVSRAMRSGKIMTKNEKAEFAGDLIAADLEKLLFVVAEERLEAARKTARKLIQIGAWTLAGFILSGLGIFVMIFWVQGQGMMSQMNSLGSF